METTNVLNALKGAITVAEALVAQLEAREAEKQKPWPQPGDDFWVFQPGYKKACRLDYADSSEFEFMLNLGIAFQTKAECERWIEARNIETYIRSMPGVVPRSPKTFAILKFDRGWDTVQIESVSNSTCGVHFDTLENANKALHAITTEDLNLWLADYQRTPITEV